MERLGVPKDVLDLVMTVVPGQCKRCMEYQHARHRPRVKSHMGRAFNHIIQCDLFYLWDSVFILLIDECTRYKLVDVLKSRTYDDISSVFSKGWLRYFGPPRIFLTDQEGALVGEDFGRLCDKYGVERWLAGSDPHHLGRGGKHTANGLAEQTH